MIYYFGALEKEGHFLYNSHGTRMTRYDPKFPFNWDFLDGGTLKLIPNTEQGQISLVRLYANKQAWTVLSFWDQSGDSRPGSLSVFIQDAPLTAENMILNAKKVFPQVFSRITFELRT